MAAILARVACGMYRECDGCHVAMASVSGGGAHVASLRHHGDGFTVTRHLRVQLTVPPLSVCSLQ